MSGGPDSGCNALVKTVKQKYIYIYKKKTTHQVACGFECEPRRRNWYFCEIYTRMMQIS